MQLQLLYKDVTILRATVWVMVRIISDDENVLPQTFHTIRIQTKWAKVVEEQELTALLYHQSITECPEMSRHNRLNLEPVLHM